MITQAASFYGMGFTLFCIGFGCGAMFAFVLQYRKWREIVDEQESVLIAWREQAMHEYRMRTQTENQIAALEAKLDDLHYDGRP